MLILGRRAEDGQDTIIVEHMGEALRIVLTRNVRGVAKLGFDGPQSFVIWREEVAQSQEETDQ